MREELTIKYLKEKYLEKFKTESEFIFSSPGRIELLGNHTDHNHGKVLVSSVNLKVLAVVGKRDDEKVVIYSKGYKKIEVDLNDLAIKEDEFNTSKAIVRGVISKIKELGYKIGGFNVVCVSTIFSGAGVSSSAAFEVLVAKILSVLYNNNELKKIDLAKIAQYAEINYFNKPCGLLDQCGIAFGGVNYIDFRYTERPKIKHLALNNNEYQFIIINTGDSHSKLTANYAEIKDDMREIANYFGEEYLREVDTKKFFSQKDEILEKFGERKYLRAKHFFEENKRVTKALLALENDDFKTFLKCIDDSGKSSYVQLKNCYINSEEEKLPQALKYVKSIDPESYIRVHGGGFAGTILVVIKKDKLPTILPLLKEHFESKNVMCVNLTKYGTSLIREAKGEKYVF